MKEKLARNRSTGSSSKITRVTVCSGRDAGRWARGVGGQGAEWEGKGRNEWTLKVR